MEPDSVRPESATPPQPDPPPRSGADGVTDELRMSFGDHLEELRKRVILALLGVVACGCVTLVYGKQILVWLCVPLAAVQRSVGVPAQTYTMSPLSGFAIYMKVSIVSAVILSVPWLVYQFWKFIESGLYPRERRAVLLVAPFSSVMSALGIGFMYYVLLPMSLWFLISFSASYPHPTSDGSTGILNLIGVGEQVVAASDPGDVGAVPSVSGDPSDTGVIEVNPSPRSSGITVPVVGKDPGNPGDGEVWFNSSLQELRFHFRGQTRLVPLTAASMLSPLIETQQYVNFVIMMGIGCLVAFQLPVMMLLLGWTGVISPGVVAGYRRHCVFACFVAGMLLTPSDIMSMLLMSIPLWGLFELGLLMMRLSYRHGRLSLG